MTWFQSPLDATTADQLETYARLRFQYQRRCAGAHFLPWTKWCCSGEIHDRGTPQGGITDHFPLTLIWSNMHYMYSCIDKLGNENSKHYTVLRQNDYVRAHFDSKNSEQCSSEVIWRIDEDFITFHKYYLNMHIKFHAKPSLPFWRTLWYQLIF